MVQIRVRQLNKKVEKEMMHLIKDQDDKATAVLTLEDGELTIQVKVKDENYNFVLSADDLRLIDFMRKKK